MKKTPGAKPWIKSVGLKITAPSLKDNTADIDRLIKGIKKELETEEIGIDFSMVKRLPRVLREYNYRGDAVVFEDQNSWHLIDIFPSGSANNIYVLAVDLGTSTVVVRLMALSTQETMDETSFKTLKTKLVRTS